MAGARRPTERRRDIPLIGLTATPFRGTNTARDEAARRALRTAVDSTSPRSAAPTPIPSCNESGSSPQVDHELLAGSEIKLSKGELDELNKLRPPSGHGDAQARGGRRAKPHAARAHRWLSPTTGRSFSSPSPSTTRMRWRHCCRRAGISAAAVTGDTDKGARRHYIEQFRRRRAARPHQLQRPGRRLRRAEGARALHRAPDVRAERVPADDRARPSRPRSTAAPTDVCS